jgi:hypothetical protein
VKNAKFYTNHTHEMESGDDSSALELSEKHEAREEVSREREKRIRKYVYSHHQHMMLELKKHFYVRTVVTIPNSYPLSTHTVSIAL